MEWYKTMNEVLAALLGTGQRRYYSPTEGYFVAEEWIVCRIAEEELVVELTLLDEERAKEWGIRRSGGGASTFHGTKAAAIEHVRYMNSSDDQGTYEIITCGMSPKEAIGWLDAMTPI